MGVEDMAMFLDDWKLKRPECVPMDSWLLLGYAAYCSKNNHANPEIGVSIQKPLDLNQE